MAKKLIYRKAERKKICDAAMAAYEAFTPVKVRGERVESTIYPRIGTPTYTFQTRLGLIDTSVDTSEGMCHVYFQFDDTPARESLYDLKWDASLNPHCGKWNAWTTPDGSPDPLDREAGALLLVSKLKQLLTDLEVDPIKAAA